MNTKKVTKKEQYNVLLDILKAAEGTIELEGDITYASLTEFINHEIELLDNKAAAAQERAAKKKAEGDELREKVLNTLSTEEFMTPDAIVDALGDADVTRNMVISRLTQLGEKGTNQVEKSEISVPAATEGGKARKAVAYRRKA